MAAKGPESFAASSPRRPDLSAWQGHPAERGRQSLWSWWALGWLVVPLAGAGLVAIRPDSARPVEAALGLWTLLGCMVAHELGHGMAARDAGDSSAQERGRLSLSPLAHLDPIGSLLVPALSAAIGWGLGVAVMVGWARPVPVDVARLRDPRRGPLRVALAGPLVNLVLLLATSLYLVVMVVLLGRIHPGAVGDLRLDTLPVRWLHSQVLPAIYPWFYVAFTIGRWSLLLNAFLIGVNLLPIPPLDGGWLLQSLVPRSLVNWLERVQGWLLGAAALLLLSGGFGLLLWPVALIWYAAVLPVGLVTGIPMPELFR